MPEDFQPPQSLPPQPPTPEPPLQQPSPPSPPSIQPLPSKRKNLIKIIIGVLIAIVVIAGGFYFWQKRQQIFKPAYSQIYRLVNEKISQSASIVVYLPADISREFAQQNVKFSPEIEGEWMLNGEKEAIFKPKNKLDLNRYYLVQLAMAGGSLISSDFLAVEDPKIIAVFPRPDSESPENSEITIVFNRPMVPLTTLGYLEEKEVPVEITPATKGRFKWITTRNLQFIPEERLIRSSHYKVKVKSGLVSTDGLEVGGAEIEFMTRKLRYLNLTEGTAIYNQPISIYFNQSVDLEKTKPEISITDNITGKEIPFIAEYKRKNETSTQAEDESETYGFLKETRDFLADISSQLGFNLFPKKETSGEIDKSVIQIYNQRDRFSREKLWDFEHNYSLKINKAYPLEGDIILDEARQTNIFVPGIIASLTAESQRTSYATPDFFDPQGKLWVNFYEEISLDKSEIIVPKIEEIGYGEKCKDETAYSNAECEKIQDKKKIYITFKSGEIDLEEKLEINFKKIVNLQGLTINKEPIKKSITSYPKFKILSKFPSNNSVGASLTEFILCSNSPILTPAKEDYNKYLKANLDYKIDSWKKSWRVDYPDETCQEGEFHTLIYYGLMPQNNYSLEYNLEDVFGQKFNFSLEFTTGLMPNEFLSFYHLQKDYNVTSPLKTKLTFGAKNMDYVNLEICKLDPFYLLHYLENKPKQYEPFSTANCKKIIRDKIELPQKYWIINYFSVNLKDYFSDPLGHYILTFSHPNYFISRSGEGNEFYRPIYERSYLSITNLAVAEKKIQAELANYGAEETLNS